MAETTTAKLTFGDKAIDLPMRKGTILMLCGPEYEDLEVWYPKLRLEEAGYVFVSEITPEYRKVA